MFYLYNIPYYFRHYFQFSQNLTFYTLFPLLPYCAQHKERCDLLPWLMISTRQQHQFTSLQIGFYSDLQLQNITTGDGCRVAAAGLRMMWSMQSAAELNDRQKIQLHFHLQNSHHTPHSTLVQGEPLTPLNKRNRSLRYQEHSTNKISHTGTLFANDDAHIHVFFVTQNCTCNLLTERLARETIYRGTSGTAT